MFIIKERNIFKNSKTQDIIYQKKPILFFLLNELIFNIQIFLKRHPHNHCLLKILCACHICEQKL